MHLPDCIEAHQLTWFCLWRYAGVVVDEVEVLPSEPPQRPTSVPQALQQNMPLASVSNPLLLRSSSLCHACCGVLCHAVLCMLCCAVLCHDVHSTRHSQCGKAPGCSAGRILHFQGPSSQACFTAPACTCLAHTTSRQLTTPLESRVAVLPWLEDSYNGFAGAEQRFEASWQCASIHPLQAGAKAGAAAYQAHPACAAAQPLQALQLWPSERGELADGAAGAPHNSAAG